MASKKWSAGAVAATGLGALALGWLLFGPKSEAATDQGPPGKPPQPPSEPEGPPPPPPTPTLVGPWCSSIPSAGPPAALDPAVVAYVRENADPVVLYLWLMLALYVTGHADTLPTVQRLRESSFEHTNGFDWATQKAVDSVLPSRKGLEDPNGRAIIDVYRAFASRDPSKDRPCPVSVPADISALLADSFAETKRLSDSGV